jgi:hypothetical protein
MMCRTAKEMVNSERVVTSKWGLTVSQEVMYGSCRKKSVSDGARRMGKTYG